MADADCFYRAKDALLGEGDVVAVAVSAGGKNDRHREKITDLLIDVFEKSKNGESLEKALVPIEKRLSELVERLKIKIDLIRELKDIERGALNRHSLDFLVSRGEYLYAKIFAAFVGLPFVDSRFLIKFAKNQIDWVRSTFAVREALRRSGRFLTGGFYGSDENGIIKLLPRGGGDVTGAILSKAVPCEEYVVFTDVDGILPCSPSVAEKAGYRRQVPLSEISYATADYLFDFGSPVIHSGVMAILNGSGVRVRVKNTFAPYNSGTLVLEKGSKREFCFAFGKYKELKERFKRRSEKSLYRDFLKSEESALLADDAVCLYLSPSDESDAAAKKIKDSSRSFFIVKNEEGTLIFLKYEKNKESSKNIFLK